MVLTSLWGSLPNRVTLELSKGDTKIISKAGEASNKVLIVLTGLHLAVGFLWRQTVIWVECGCREICKISAGAHEAKAEYTVYY